MSLTHLSDNDLLTSYRGIVTKERVRLAFELEHLAELDRRKLFLHHSSLQAFLVKEHGLEKWVANRKIRAARMLKRFPEIKSKMESGELNLTLLEIAQGCAHRESLPDSGLSEILEAVSGLSCDEATLGIASRYPDSVDLPKDQIKPLTKEFSQVSFVATQELIDKLEEIKGLCAHSHSKMTLCELFDLLATEYRERHHPEEKAKRAEQRKKKSETLNTVTATRLDPETEPESENRFPLQATIHQLTLKEGYQCAYIDPLSQKRCTSKHGLEIDHIHAYSQGGETNLANLRYLCMNHHKRVSFTQFGESSKYFKRE